MRRTLLLFAMMISLQQISNAQNVGIGTTAPTQKLDVNGNIQLNGALMPAGDAGHAGALLVSNGPGAAPAWKLLGDGGGGGFVSTLATNTTSATGNLGRADWQLNFATGQNDSLDFGLVTVYGNDITVSNEGLLNNYITINRTGYYHFQGSMSYEAKSLLSVTMIPFSHFSMSVRFPSGNSRQYRVHETRMEKREGSETGASENLYYLIQHFSIDMRLEAGTTIVFLPGFANLRFPNGTPLRKLSVGEFGYVSGQFIME